jgi:hypothetical protein
MSAIGALKHSLHISNRLGEYRRWLGFAQRNDSSVREYIVAKTRGVGGAKRPIRLGRDVVAGWYPGNAPAVEPNSMIDKWIDVLGMMDPIAYERNEYYTTENLLTEHYHQIQFADRILTTKFINLNIAAPSQCHSLMKEYAWALERCLEEPCYVLPERMVRLVATNPRIGFVWHAHMLDHERYASDTYRIFGRILPSHANYRKYWPAQFKTKYATTIEVQPEITV